MIVIVGLLTLVAAVLLLLPSTRARLLDVLVSSQISFGRPAARSSQNQALVAGGIVLLFVAAQFVRAGLR